MDVMMPSLVSEAQDIHWNAIAHKNRQIPIAKTTLQLLPAN